MTYHYFFTELKHLTTILFLVLYTSVYAQGIDGKFKETQEKITVDGRVRTYILHEPLQSFPPKSLVYILHGNGGNGALMKNITQFNSIADKNNILVIYPDGVDQAWNDGRSTVRVKDVDDVNFFRVLNRSILQTYDIEHIFVAGLSNGAMMALRLSCELGDTIHAVAAISASVHDELKCHTSSVSRLIMVGTNDPIISYNGGEIKSFGSRGQGGRVLGLRGSLDYFIALENIKSASIDSIENSISKKSYTYRNSKLEGYLVNGGGHTWGSTIGTIPENGVGGLPPTYINASEIIWNFFSSTKK